MRAWSLLGSIWTEIGAAIQAYLYRTPRDFERLVECGAPVRSLRGCLPREPADRVS